VIGHSGDVIKILDSSVFKYTLNKDRFPLLKAQMNKQIESKYLLAPEVYNEYTEDEIGIYGFEMEYVPGSHPLTKPFDRQLLCELEDYINQTINTSSLKDCTLVTRTKLNSFSTHRYLIDKVLGTVEKIIVPIGECHGDLTFCNIISGDKTYFIDFLPCYVESPLCDMVKLRQDTLHGWSSQFIQTRDEKKWDLELDKIFSKYDFYNKYYWLFSFINLLRIVPYAKTKTINKYLDKEIEFAFSNIDLCRRIT